MSNDFGALIPVIDISGWDSGDAPARDEIAATVDDACRTIGFMQITGHGVSDQALAALTGAIDGVFALDGEVKAQCQAARPSINRGYTPPRSERLSYSVGVDSPADMFEAFNVGVTREPPAGVDPDMYPENIWPDPDELPNCEADVQCWLDAVGALARRMTSILAHALGVGPGFFESFTDRSIDVLRMVNYAIPEGTALEQGQLGMGAHTDYGIVTILWADPVPGLEILDPDGSWQSVTPKPGALLINLGDLIARWTNDRYRSTMHRVVPPADADGRSIRRRSAAFFHDGNADAVISTLQTCRDADGGSPYDDVTVAEHLAQKLGGSRGLELNPHAAREAARIETS
jgi:isopenicillin N synthase-like dioxygenase